MTYYMCMYSNGQRLAIDTSILVVYKKYALHHVYMCKQCLMILFTGKYFNSNAMNI